MTTVTEMLAPTVDRIRDLLPTREQRENAKTAITAKALVAEDAVLSLPRPLQDKSKGELTQLLGKSVTYMVIYAITLKTGKALNFSVKDRSLSKYGRFGSIAAIVVYAPMALMIGHELWAKARRPETAQERMRRIVKKVLEQQGPPFGGPAKPIVTVHDGTNG